MIYDTYIKNMLFNRLKILQLFAKDSVERLWKDVVRDVVLSALIWTSH